MYDVKVLRILKKRSGTTRMEKKVKKEKKEKDGDSTESSSRSDEIIKRPLVGGRGIAISNLSKVNNPFTFQMEISETSIIHI